MQRSAGDGRININISIQPQQRGEVSHSLLQQLTHVLRGLGCDGAVRLLHRHRLPVGLGQRCCRRLLPAVSDRQWQVGG